MRYILWVVVVTGGLWSHQQWSASWPPSWILPMIRNQVKTARNCNFFPLDMSNNTQISNLHHFIHNTFINERSWENMHFRSKMACPPASYDVISRNHSNWLSLNLSQNACERKAPENVRCWCFIVWKNSEKPPPPPMNVRGLKDGMQSGYINCSILL